jgi:hypothetical protein
VHFVQILKLCFRVSRPHCTLKWSLRFLCSIIITLRTGVAWPRKCGSEGSEDMAMLSQARSSGCIVIASSCLHQQPTETHHARDEVHNITDIHL